MLRAFLPAALVLAFASAGAGAATSPTTTLTARSVLVVTGHGLGHGLGMAQWGAYGYAQHGWTYDRILAHYYPGTTLGTTKVASIRVLLAQEATATLSAAVAWSVTDASGTVVQLAPATPVTIAADLTVDGRTLTAPLTFRAAQPLQVDGKPYRGRIVVTALGKAVQIVDVVGLEQYVKGVVAEEMPSGWATGALKAQAVATRSYALGNLARAGTFDLYGDGRSQVYGGVDAETPSASAAVDATKHQVVLYNGKVADTMFFSSSGGRTASAKETTGISVPYLTSVADPYDTISPYHDWGPVLFDLAKVAKALKLTVPIDDLQVTPGASGRARTVTVLTGGEPSTTFSGNQIRTALNLRSTWFTPVLLQLLPPARAMTFGGTAELTGFVRGTGDPLSLESRAPGGAWQPAGALSLGADGTFAVPVEPQVTTQYRLVWGSVRAGLARVGVAPLVSVAQTGTTGVAGTVAPVVAGSVVELQQQSGTAWTTVSSATLGADGSWSFGGRLAPGTYRVRCAPGHGLVAGMSGTLQVQ
jgi:stage II sporulation protein D